MIEHEKAPLICEHLSELPQTVKQLLETLEKAPPVWLFEAEMGAGKTTLIREICGQWGVLDNVSSPTFALINEYETQKKGTIFHFDFYRLRKEEEAFELGLEDYFESDQPCLVEWPSRIPSFWPSSFLTLEIQVGVQQQRLIYTNEHHE